MDAYISRYICAFIILFISRASHGLLYDDETRLLKDLLGDYDGKVPPIINRSAPLDVDFGLYLQQIHEVDEVKGILQTTWWLNYNWHDARLKWNISEYGRIQTVRIPPTDIWIPDIMPYNYADTERFMAMEDATRAVVYATGLVSWVPVVTLQTTCSIDLTNFPFDTQVCTLKFGSWTYNGAVVNLKLMWDAAITSTFSKHANWELVGTNASRNEMKYDCCPEPYVDLTFNLTLVRRSGCYTYLYVLPYVFLNLAMPAIFLLSHTGPHRCVFGGAMVMSMVILMGSLEWNLSGHGFNTPKLSIFYIGSFVLSIISMILANLMMSMAAKSHGNSPPPQWLTSICGRFPASVFRCWATAGSEDKEALHAGGSAGESAGQQRQWTMIAHVFDCIFFILVLFVLLLMAMITLIH